MHLAWRANRVYHTLGRVCKQYLNQASWFVRRQVRICRAQKTLMRIVVLDDFHRTYEASAGIARLREFAEVKIHSERPASRDELLERLRGVPIIIANRERTRFTADLFASLPSLQLLCNTGGHA